METKWNKRKITIRLRKGNQLTNTTIDQTLQLSDKDFKTAVIKILKQ